MKFEFKFSEVDQEAFHRLQDTIEVTDRINEWIKEKNYGEDIPNYAMYCICVKSRPGYEDWFKVRKPKFVNKKGKRNNSSEEVFSITKVFFHEIKIDGQDFDLFIRANNLESQKFILDTIINSLESREGVPKKIKSFDFEKFRDDLIELKSTF